MTIEKERSHSPVHLHVDEATPVHVHVKKPKKIGQKQDGPHTAVSKNKAAAAYGSSNLRRSTASARSRSKSPVGAGPWVPPPGKTSKGSKYAWQGQNARLEISNPQDAEMIQNTLRMSDLSTDEEDQVQNQMRQYEKKIDGLMTEVGSLKNEVELQRTLREYDHKEEELDSSRRVLEEQERELDDYRRELRISEAENELLRSSYISPTAKRSLSPSRMDSEHLMKKLVEVEMDGQAAAKQTAALRDTINRLKPEKRLSSSDSALLAKQKALLMERLGNFEMTNRTLRKHLRDRHEQEAASMRLTEQRDLLLQKLSETEDTTQRLKNELLERDRQTNDMKLQMEAQQEENVAISGLQSTLESNRAHLQKQLRQKDGDCNRMAVQIRNLKSELAQAKAEVVEFRTLHSSESKLLNEQVGRLEQITRDLHDKVSRTEEQAKNLETELIQSKSEAEAFQMLRSSESAHMMDQAERLQDLIKELREEVTCSQAQAKALETQLAQERIEVDHLQGLLKAAKEKAERDKEALKKATRVQKQRATRSEDAAESLNVQIMERDNFIGELRSELQDALSQTDKITKEKSQLQAEKTALNTRVGELESIMNRVEDSCKKEVETSTAKLHEKTTEAATMRLENERLKTSIATIEDKLRQTEDEVSQLRSGLKQYETLVDEYRGQNEGNFRKNGIHPPTLMNRSRREADETMIQLEEQKRETNRVHRDGESELDRVKGRLQSRLAELEPIPELLKTTELKLQDANEKLLAYEKRNTDNTKLIAELTAKVEYQSDQIGQVQDKMHAVIDENRGAMTRSEVLERKLRDLEEQNRDLLQTSAKREETIHQLTLRLEEKSSESSTLSRQLESALSDVRRLTETTREKVACKERSSQSRILDLESQLSALRAESARVKREKDEAERKFNSRLYDLKDRLEQSHSTNRSMQNYVQFLKSSYANVFGDSTALAGTSPCRTTFPY